MAAILACTSITACNSRNQLSRENSLGETPAIPIYAHLQILEWKNRIGQPLWSKKNQSFQSKMALSVELKNLDTAKLIAISPREIAGARVPKLRFFYSISNGKIFFKDYDAVNARSIFNDEWHLSNPKLSHPKWPSEIWNKLMKHQIEVGMTSEMLKISLGEPESIEHINAGKRHSEIWAYSLNNTNNDYFYLQNDKIFSIKR